MPTCLMIKMIHGKPIKIPSTVRYETFYCEKWKSAWCEDGSSEVDQLLIQLNSAQFSENYFTFLLT